jgi:hypothetical protein
MSHHQILHQNRDAAMTVRKSLTVKRPLADAFSLFTEQIGSWWPLKEGFSFGGERA